MNPARTTLGVIGGILLVIGGIAASIQKAAADKAVTSDGFSDALSGVTNTTDPLAYHTADALYAAMWGGVAAAVVGILLLIGLLIAMAVQPRTVAVSETTKEPASSE